MSEEAVVAAEKGSKTSQNADADRSKTVSKNKDQDAYKNNINVIKKAVLPKVEATPGDYVPMPYVFRIPPVTSQANVQNQTTRCPPFYIQIDHAIAVIWCLFSKQSSQKQLGINQLQWAMSFLKTIRNDKGRIPNDVAFCVDIIGNELIEQYAQLAEKLSTGRDGKPAGEGAEGEGDATEAAAEEAPPEEAPKSSSHLLVKQNVPFSINYADMINRSPPGPDNYKRLVEREKEPCEGEEAIKSNMVSFLGEWRRDQMKKILMELDRLHSIEAYLDKNSNGFEPYMDDKDKEMSVLLAEKMKRAKVDKE